MTIFQDIHIDDNNLKNLYISYFLNGNYQAAFSLIENNPQLDTKAFLADYLNEISTIIFNTESDTYYSIIPYLNELEADFNTIVNQFINLQLWSSATQYKLYNFVYYNNLVYMYINEQPSVGNLPTNTTYWLEIGLQGDKGFSGVSDLNLRYDWDSTTTYQAKDVVTYDDAMWVATQSNTNQIPSEISSYWILLSKAELAEIFISDTEPSEKYEGQIWYEILTNE